MESIKLNTEFDEVIAQLKHHGIDDSVIGALIEFKNSNKDSDDIVKEIIAEAYSMKEQKHKDDRVEQDRTDHLWQMAQDNILEMTISRTSIYLDIVIGKEKITCLLDTGAQSNIITTEIVKLCGLESFVDKSVKHKIYGVGESNILGVIHYMDININGYECGCNFSVMDKIGKTKIILGLPFMMHYGVTLDFKKRKMTIGSQDVKMIIQEFA